METGCFSFFSAEDHLVIGMALQRLSKTVSISGVQFGNLIPALADDLEAVWTVANHASRDSEEQEGFVFTVKMSASDTLNEGKGLRTCVASFSG